MENREREVNAGRQPARGGPVRSCLSHTVRQLQPESRQNAAQNGSSFQTSNRYKRYLSALKSNTEATNTEDSSEGRKPGTAFHA